jgi:hypothetical protein
VDVLFHPSVNLRAGILLAPIGKFNLAHDAPLYDVVERPLVSTEIIGATHSQMGFGLFGSLHLGGGHRLTYEAYAVNGLADGVIAAEGTRVAAGKSDAMFEEDNNGVPAAVGRLAYVSPLAGRWSGEFGASAYGGIYNQFAIEGDEVDDARWLRILALDAELRCDLASFRGEFAYAHIDTPPGVTDLHARDQWGVYGELSHSFFQRALGPFDKARLLGVVRVEYLDRNANKRAVSGDAIGDETLRLTLGPSFRPAAGTSIRLSYRHDWMRDPLNNPLRAAGLQLGVATYF